jgi:hypothetical protein
MFEMSESKKKLNQASVLIIMRNYSIALMIFGEPGAARNALTEEKYRKLAAHLIEKEFNVVSVLYNDTISDKLAKELLRYNAILVWVNPIEQRGDRKILDALLMDISAQGSFVSAHPDTILKMGTKEVLYKIRETEFGGDTKLYHSFDDFKERFLKVQPGIRILKQYRGNGGDGVFKIDTSNFKENNISITHAKNGNEEILVSVDDLFIMFESYFKANSLLIDQEWNQNIINGMVRCYLSGSKVTGFGYQEINALYPKTEKNLIYKKPSQRFYFSEDCGLFSDLKNIMEKSWVAQLQEITGIKNEMLPVIWDADFFINKINTENTNEKYTLCEINVSCVSPFPESSIPYIAEEVKKRICT